MHQEGQRFFPGILTDTPGNLGSVGHIGKKIGAIGARRLGEFTFAFVYRSALGTIQVLIAFVRIKTVSDRVRGTCDDLFLISGTQIHEVCAETPHADDQVSVLLRLALCGPEGFGIDHVRLKLNAAQ